MKRALVVLVACGGSGIAKPLEVAGNLSLPAPTVSMVVELEDAVYVFDSRELTIFRNGSKSSTTPAPSPWHSTTTIAALHGEGRWVVATTSDGNLWRVRSTGELEPIGDRVGFGTTHAFAISGAGNTTALSLDGGFAVSTDGKHLARYDKTGAIAVASERLARLIDGGVELWNLTNNTRVTYLVPEVRRATFLDADSKEARLVAVTEHSLYLQNGDELERIDAPGPIRDIAVSKSRLWVLSGNHLYVLDGGKLVATDATVMTATTLHGSGSGDVWIGDANLVRYSIGRNVVDSEWHRSVEPVFRRVCARCHQAGGEAGVDLSTPGAWTAERTEIIRRVLVTRTMPPSAVELTDSDRADLSRWLRP